MVQTKTDRGIEKKREILEAASRAFRRKGLHATGMRDIAAEARMQAGNLYYYFDNKQALLAFCQEETLDRMLELSRRIRQLDLRQDAQLYLLIVAHVYQLNEGTPGSLAHLEAEALEEPRRTSLRKRRDDYEHVYRQVIRSGIDSGIFRDVDPKVVTLAVLGALNWTVKWFRPDGEKSAEAIGQEFAELLVAGLLAPGTEPSPPPRLSDILDVS